MIKRFIIAIILIVLVCGGLVGFNLFKEQKIAEYFANRPRPTVTVSTVTAEAQSWKPGIEAIGTVGARQGVDVASRAAGIVTGILFAANDQIEKGQLLVQLDDEEEQATLIAAKANEARDSQALKRATTLVDKGVSSTSALDDAKAALDASRSVMERVKAQINLKKIRAPFSGTIGIPKIDVGEYLPAGTVIATLQDLKVMKVDFTVAEQRLSEVHIGQPLHLGLAEDAMGYEGKITGIDPKIDPQSRLVSIQAEVGNSDGALRPGQFAFVRIDLPQENNIIALPQTAVVQSLYGTYVYMVAEDDKAPAAADGKKKLVARQVFVKVGRRFGGKIEITDGVKPGDVIVSAGQNKLTVGSPVTIDNTVNPADTAEKPGA
ncbi:efflux RND transporter periplasmic adaptor subunit [Roseibium aggregatum]|uniref:Efflux RND transporter periplasmic adaptor subunit n=1 Tax=Roseibium aggregatum TaxID=187304 RepID=A0A926NRR3_9HYPH|nr:efflux RND transporter periplasmic adaptor subunit [Roseibium aggregatum]MBD1546162.1 efflux RND transporter periplasmic adaptor subunit [Roseibium aggregatum]